MFSSLATFLFGAQATSESTNSETNPVQQNLNSNDQASGNDQAAGDVIEVTSTTPSVAGSQRGSTVHATGSGKRGAKNRRARQRYQRLLQKEQQQEQQQQQNSNQKQQQGGQRKQTPTLTKLLTPNNNDDCTIDEDFNEDEWYIVEKEEEEEDSLPRTDSEEELSVVEHQAKAVVGAGAAPTRRRQQHINSHSLYSGPRPQQQRNYLQRTRAARTLNISTLSPPSSLPASESESNNAAVGQSLYAPIAISTGAMSPSGSSDSSDSSGSSGSKGNGSGVLMEESWYVTPPPCFTSIGPINMETSPFENLLIEHPSMSVYHSIRSSQARIDSFVNLDLGAAELQQPDSEPEREREESQEAQTQVAEQQQQQQQRRSNSARFSSQAAVELKQQTLARQSQKSNNKKQHQQLCRSAIKRANKVRDFQAKSHRPRRSEMQSCKLVSGANNNRKSC